MSLTPNSNRRQGSGAGGRMVVALLLVASIAATALTRGWVMDSRAVATKAGRVGSEVAGGAQSSSLSAMPSYATALLLGGLRGPLVMILWQTSESQKQEHDLQDFDTKIEWIRLLQPEFDTVHLFQIWNKAYNISVMMADQANKYTTVLDAIDYGQKVDRERPDDINIIVAIAAIYGDKLGTSQEHPYYRRQVRKETQTRYRVRFPASRVDEFRKDATTLGWSEGDAPLSINQKTNTQSALLERPVADALQKMFNGADVSYEPEMRRAVQSDDPTWRRLRLDPMLDVDGNIFPDLLEARYPRPANLAAGEPWYDGSQLEFLKPYQPFKYGISTLALAYNDYKRAQLLQSQWNERHIQSSETVIDSRPAINLKLWAKDEWERGRRSELRMWGHSMASNVEPDEMELPTAPMRFDRLAMDPLAHEQALDCYKLAARLFVDSRNEYFRHIRKYPYNAQTYLVHLDDTITGEHMMRADYEYLMAGSASGAQRNQLANDAAHEYMLAAQHAAITVLKYYINDDIAAQVFKNPRTGEKYTRATIETSDPNIWLKLLHDAQEACYRTYVDENDHYFPVADSMHDDREPYMKYVQRASERLGVLIGKPLVELPHPPVADQR